MTILTIYLSAPSSFNSIDFASNDSVQVEDEIYFTKTTTSGGFDVNNGPIYKVGKVYKIEKFMEVDNIAQYVKLEVKVYQGATVPEPGDFIMFSKDRGNNERSIPGYYGEMKWINTSNIPSELFQVGAEVEINS
jgi:hypothetical protein